MDDLNESDQKEYIQKAMNYLKPIEQTLITMFYLDEFSTKEMVEITGLTNSNIKVSLLRIRKKLYGIMKKA